MLAGAAVILRSRWHVARNVFWRGAITRKISSLLALLVAIGISYGLFRLSGLVVRGLQLIQREEPRMVTQLGDLPRLLAAVPSIALAGSMVPLLLGSISFALGTLYFARDLEQLLVTPVPVRSVFFARFVEGMLPIYLLLFLLLLPALAGYGLAWGYGWLYLLLLPGVLLLLPLLPVSLGTMLTVVLVRIVPPQRLRELMAALGGIVGLLVYGGTQVLGRAARDIDTVESVQRLLRLDIPALPTTWAARLLVSAGLGDGMSMLRYGLPYVLVTLGSFALSLLVVERLFYAGWSGVAGSAGGRVRRERRRERRVLLPGPAGAIFRKDLLMLPRDLQRLSQLLLPLGLSIFWTWQLIFEQGSRMGRTNSVVLSLTMIALLVGMLISSNLGLTGLSREGQGYWLIQLAPISPWSILWAKTALAYLPFPVVGTLFAGLAALLRRPPAGDLLQAWTIVLLTGIGVSGICTGAGAAFPRFNWTQAQRMMTLRAGCLAPVAYYGYAALMLVLTLGSQRLTARWGTWVPVAGWSMALVLTVVALFGPLALAAARMRRLEL